MVDLYPLALHVTLCDNSGRPGGRERLVLTSHHFSVKEMVKEILSTARLQPLRRALTVGGTVNNEQVK